MTAMPTALEQRPCMLRWHMPTSTPCALGSLLMCMATAALCRQARYTTTQMLKFDKALSSESLSGASQGPLAWNNLH